MKQLVTFFLILSLSIILSCGKDKEKKQEQQLQQSGAFNSAMMGQYMVALCGTVTNQAYGTTNGYPGNYQNPNSGMGMYEMTVSESYTRQNSGYNNNTYPGNYGDYNNPYNGQSQGGYQQGTIPTGTRVQLTVSDQNMQYQLMQIQPGQTRQGCAYGNSWPTSGGWQGSSMQFNAAVITL